MKSYDLLREDFIPVRYLNGEKKNINLQKLFEESHLILDINEPDHILYTSFLNFILNPLTYRIANLKDFETWKFYYQKSNFSKQDIINYFNKYKDRFDLLHKEFPFLQPKIDLDEIKNDVVSKKELSSKSSNELMAYKTSTGNNIIFRFNSSDDVPIKIPLNRVPFFICAYISRYMTQGGTVFKRKHKIPNMKKDNFYNVQNPYSKNAKNIFKGDNLFETLMFNTIAEFNKSNNFNEEEDLCLWEQENDYKKYFREDGYTPKGYCDLMTNPHIIINLNEVNDNRELESVYFIPGRRIDKEAILDPYSPICKKINKEKKVYYTNLESESINLNAPWSDLPHILGLDPNITSSKNQEMIEKAVNEGVINEHKAIKYFVSLFVFDKSKYVRDFMLSLSLSLKIIQNDSYRDTLIDACEKSSIVAKKIFKKHVVSYLKEIFPAEKDFNGMAEKFLYNYWYSISAIFPYFYKKMLEDEDEAYLLWEKELKTNALNCFEQLDNRFAMKNTYRPYIVTVAKIKKDLKETFQGEK